MTIVWSPLALDRVAEIAGYIARDKPSAAEQWVKAVFVKVEQLEISPELGRVVPEIGALRFRELLYSQYRIVYRIEEKSISILTVRHGRQELPIDEIEG